MKRKPVIPPKPRINPVQMSEYMAGYRARSALLRKEQREETDKRVSELLENIPFDSTLTG
jgi:hypothetical protein